jgi:hypothetical protein
VSQNHSGNFLGFGTFQERINGVKNRPWKDKWARKRSSVSEKLSGMDN